jgi:hypothetical protein
MPGEISYENQGAGVVITWTGPISGDEVKEINKQIYAKERLDKLRYQIWDFTKADRLDISTQDVRDFAMQDRTAAQTNPDQIAAIVGSAEFFKGYDQIFHIYEDVWAGFESRTFSTVAEAREWVASVTEYQQA